MRELWSADRDFSRFPGLTGLTRWCATRNVDADCGGPRIAGRYPDSAGLPRAVELACRGASPTDGSERFERNGSGDQTARPQYVKRALDYMNGNLAEKITLAELASACGTSERTLLKQFQRFLGLPPLAYLRAPSPQYGAQRTPENGL